LFLPLVAVVPTAPLLALVLAAMGLLDAPADVGMNAIGVRVEEAHGRSVMTRLHGLWSLGTVIGSGVSALAVLAGIGLGLQLSVISILAIGIALYAARLIPDAPPRMRKGARSGKLAVGLILAGGFAVFAESTPFDWSAIFIVDVTGSGQAMAGAGLIVFTAGMLIGRLAGDQLIDRYGAIPTLYAGVTVSVCAMLLVVTLQTVPSALGGFLVWGLGVSVVLPVLYKLAGSHRSFGEGSGLAALTVGTRLGFMVAPALIGVAAASWSLPIAFAVVGTLAAAACLLTVRLTIATPVRVVDRSR
jgi:predicted MFS family arabinose efflux permease